MCPKGVRLRDHIPFIKATYGLLQKSTTQHFSKPEIIAD